MKIVRLRDFSLYPGPRFERLGPDSGERFRNEVLIPSLEESSNLTVDLDGVISAPGSSFLDEAFAGLIRAGISESIVVGISFISNDDPPLIDEIKSYIQDAVEASR